MFSRLGDRLRIAGTVELNGYKTELNEVRCRALLRRAEELFPGAGDMSRAQFWTPAAASACSRISFLAASRRSSSSRRTREGRTGRARRG